MKEFIDKLIGRLNKKARWVAYGAWDRDIGMTHKVVPFSDLREIVNQLAEEYKKESVKGDLISKSAAIDVIWDVFNQYCNDSDRFDEYETKAIDRAFKRLQNIFEKQPTACNYGWIPCEKEIPPQPKENPLFENKPLELYLATVKGSEYPWRVFWNGKSFTDGWSEVDVLAWMELPKPYQPKGE